LLQAAVTAVVDDKFPNGIALSSNALFHLKLNSDNQSKLKSQL
jgi:hypothetical protein